jgi:hypothetical protein
MGSAPANHRRHSAFAANEGLYRKKVPQCFLTVNDTMIQRFMELMQVPLMDRWHVFYYRTPPMSSTKAGSGGPATGTQFPVPAMDGIVPPSPPDAPPSRAYRKA